MSVNVILPCAGSGSRLGLPSPKELYEVQRNRRLIDLSIELLLPHRASISRVTIILTPQKSSIVTYLAKWKKHLPIVFCYFNDLYYDWPGSILSSSHLFQSKNVVLLPDTFIREAPALRIVPTMERRLDNYNLVFGFVREKSKRLERFGALMLGKDKTISAFCDKPKRALSRFNAFWGTFGFRREQASTILEMMTESVKGRAVDIGSLGLGKIAGFPLLDYQDLGTWEDIAQYRLRIGERPPTKRVC